MSTLTEVQDQEFTQEVLEAGQPVLVDFWAAWCGPCQMLSPVVDEVAAEGRERFRTVKVNVDKSPLAAERFGVKSIPTLILFSDGKETARLVGYRGKQAILEQLEPFLG